MDLATHSSNYSNYAKLNLCISGSTTAFLFNSSMDCKFLKENTCMLSSVFLFVIGVENENGRGTVKFTCLCYT
jgi:hypothetical protein